MPKKYLTVNEVAMLMGVTPLTVRNWDKKRRLIAYRHPVNNYRIYKIEDVEALLKQIERPAEIIKTAPEKDTGSSSRKLEIEEEV